MYGPAIASSITEGFAYSNAALINSSGVCICKSEENDLKHGNYICKSEGNYIPISRCPLGP
jgi:hypothetical protein